MSDKPKKIPPDDRLAPRAVVSRLSLYLRQLEALQATGQSRVSSNQIATMLHLRDAQVRKDLAFFGQFGHPGIGYQIDELQVSIRKALGTDRLGVFFNEFGLSWIICSARPMRASVRHFR